ncbi:MULTISPECIES: hypothetical protein [Haloarcula]|uniref:Uncharacterized protein n=3 Tax=Haloarcula TaxID=2237 RepID=A0ACC6VRN2_9EURY|nr:MULTISPECIES: hypothetical protein [Haloarcula]EMA31338.1 hypothetical protein C444_08250 [Haloarcula japonica DSM 6131]GGK78853.1 hypothetical protein GCM10009067_33930 [Haloarcula sebkhae]
MFLGEPRSSTEGTLGLADVTEIIANMLIDGVSAISQPILDGVIDLSVQLVVEFFNWMRPAGLPGVAIVYTLVVVVYATSLRTAVRIVLDFIPGGGASII